MRSSSPGFHCLLPALLLFTLAAPQAQETQTAEPVQVHQGVPPKALRGAEMRAALFENSFPMIDSTASYDTVKKEITLDWFRTGPKQVSQQIESVTYYPTAVAGMDDNRLLVAGKHPRTNATIIELWEFDALAFIPGPTVDGTTGEVVWPEIRVPIKSRTVLLDQAVVGQDMVFAMFWNLADANSAFVQFYDSRDLYSLDFSTKTTTRILTATPEPGLPTEPKLGWDFNDRASLRHKALGNVYLLLRSNSSSHRALALIDANEDGTLDLQATLSVGSDSQLKSWYDSGIMDPKLVEAYY